MRKIENVPMDHLVVNPHLWLSPTGALPRPLERLKPLLDDFALQGPIAWVCDPLTGIALPFWIGPESASLLSRVPAGNPVPDSCAGSVRRRLAAAGILVQKESLGLRRKRWAEFVLNSRRAFERGYVAVPELLHPFHIAALRRYYRYLIRNGKLRLGDKESPLRYGVHNQSVARFFHHQLAGVVTDLAGEPVKPSYVYVASYQSGAKLEKHSDRPQCEFSITLCLDYSPEPADETPWPIHLEAAGDMVTIHQRLGDGLLYRGCQVPHWRDQLPQGNTSTSMFFHYVRQDFVGELD